MVRFNYCILASFIGLKTKSYVKEELLDGKEDKRILLSKHQCCEEKLKLVQLQCEEFMLANNIPGMVVGVSVNGESIWQQGFGMKDVENRVDCSVETSMLISSISKPIVALVAVDLYRRGILHLDEDVTKYVPQFPEKIFDSNKATITLRQLLSHTAGVRHYRDDDEPIIRRPYIDVIESLDLFKNDPLLHAPGSKFSYSTYAYTLVSAALQQRSGMDFVELMLGYLKVLGMHHTFPNHEQMIIKYRSRYYRLEEDDDDEKLLMNAPYTDCSYKWAGGGLTSTVADLLRFGSFMLSAYQDEKDVLTKQSRFWPLTRQMAEMMWTPITVEKDTEDLKRGYGLGWRIEYLPIKESGGNLHVYHTGAGSGNS